MSECNVVTSTVVPNTFSDRKGFVITIHSDSAVAMNSRAHSDTEAEEPWWKKAVVYQIYPRSLSLIHI